MTTLPTSAHLLAVTNVADAQTDFAAIVNVVTEMPGGTVASTLTIAAGAVTPTVACHLVDTEAAAASDDLTNIVTTNHPDGRRLLISMVDAARIVTVKHNAGGAGQIALANSYDLVLKVGGWVELKRTGANWEEVGRSQNLISAIQLSGAVNEAYVTVASHATTADIWGAKGNVINFTGTATVTAFPNAPQAGVRRRLICAGACSFTAGASMVIDGVASASTLTAAAGDVVDIESVSTTSFKLHYMPVGGVLSRAGGTMTGALNEAQGSDIASASTINLTTATGNVVDVTGTTAITAITLAQGAERWVRFTGALILTNGASLVLLGGANITTATGDFACFRGYGSSVVRMMAWCPAGSLPGLLGRTNTWVAAQGCSNNILTDGSTITPDLSGPNEGWVILGGSRTLGIPTNMVAGKRQRFAWDVLQDATGSRTLAYVWCYNWAGGTAGTLSTPALSRDKLFGDVAYYATSTVTITIATPGVVSWTAHGLRTGDKLQITTTGALPTGLSSSTTYFAIKNDTDSFWLATSLANAAAGTKIATSGSQSGTHTIVACAIDLSLNKAFS